MTDDLGWGILGTGGIAADFAADLALLPGHRLAAVGSRQRPTAVEFATRVGAGHAHGSYAELCADADVDVVYVATPHPFHARDALLALRAGKHVLCEKPFTVNAGEAMEVVAAARSGGLLCMEAMWTRFLPHMRAVRHVLESGRLGELRTVIADHGQCFLPVDPSSRLYAADIAGGALLDLGIYPLSFSFFVMGTPAHTSAVSDPTATGVDAQTSVVLRYDGGGHSVLTTTLSAETPTRASVTGTEGRIEIDPAWYRPTSFTVYTGSGEMRYDELVEGNGLRFQAEEVAQCIRAGRLESDIMPLSETLAIMQTMDAIRSQIGLRYPFET
jgi:predicted dehydrogenase